MFRYTLAAASSWLALTGVAHAQVATPPDVTSPSPDTAAGGVADIIVTANRRNELNQTVPIAITALSTKAIQQLGISKSQDLQSLVPSLVVGANGQGSREAQTFTLRGQGATFQASPGVVVYMNEVPLPAPITITQQGGPGNYVDLENLQVLAGPQGTLFGRNTTGGAILLVPHKPTNDFSGYVDAKLGNYSTREVEGAINVPVVSEKLLVRVAGAYHDRNGYTRDVVHDKDLDDTHWYSGRLGVTFHPDDRFNNYLLAYGSYSKFNGTGLIHQGFNIPGLQAVGFCVDPPIAPPGPSFIAVRCDYYRGLTARADALGPRATAPGVDQGQTTKTWGVTNTTGYDLSDELTLRNIVSYQRFKSFYYYDGDGTAAQQYDPALRSNPLPTDDLRVFTEEFQVQGSMLDKNLTFTVGAFYYDQKPAGDQGYSGIVYCPAAFTGFCSPSMASVSVENESTAVYAQAALNFGVLSPALERLKLTGGVRYTWDRIKGSAYSFTAQPTGAALCANSGALIPAGGDPTVGCTFAATLRSHAPTWVVGLDYQLTSKVLAYGKVSRGYKAGGFNSYSVFPSSRTFTPEFVTSFEVGVKSDFTIAGVPSRLNGTYYFLNYTNIQKATGDYNPQTNASGARINPARAHVQGVEIAAIIKPVRAIELGGTFSYTDFKYTKYQITSNGFLPDCSGTVPAPGTLANIKCLPGQYISPYIFSVHAALDVPISASAGNLSAYINYSHNASQHTEATVLPPNQPGEKLSAFGLLSVSVDWTNILHSGADIGLYATNLSNKLYRISNSDVFQSGSLLTRASIYGEPRMYGVRLRYRFGESR